MIDFFAGALLTAIVFTFFPTLGMKISDGVRRGWAVIRKWFGPRSDVE